MLLASQIVTGLVAVLHVYFLVLEMFLWTTRYAQKTFQRTAEQQEESKVLAANQGLYNGFLVAGLVWTLITGDLTTRIFFHACVAVAGLYGGFTASKKIFAAQMVPGILGVVFTYLAAHG
jgi:putative membrane protein